VTWKLLFDAFGVDADKVANLPPNPDIQTSKDTTPTNSSAIMKDHRYLPFCEDRKPSSFL
jgi:hypothetical protein